MCRLFANTTPKESVYIRLTWALAGFGIPSGSNDQSPMGMGRQLYFPKYLTFYQRLCLPSIKSLGEPTCQFFNNFFSIHMAVISRFIDNLKCPFVWGFKPGLQKCFCIFFHVF